MLNILKKWKLIWFHQEGNYELSADRQMYIVSMCFYYIYHCEKSNEYKLEMSGDSPKDNMAGHGLAMNKLIELNLKR